MCDEMLCPNCGGKIVLTDPDHGSCDTCDATYEYGEINYQAKYCIWPECPYCPTCPFGYEYISDEEAEFYRVDGECNTEWICNITKEKYEQYMKEHKEDNDGTDIH